MVARGRQGCQGCILGGQPWEETVLEGERFLFHREEKGRQMHYDAYDASAVPTGQGHGGEGASNASLAVLMKVFLAEV